MLRSLLPALIILATGSAGAGTLYLPAIGGGYALPVTSLKEIRFKSTLRQQYDFSCGSAAIATLLTHQYGYPISEQAVFQEMYARGDQKKIQREGFSLLDMKRYLEAQGFAADGFAQPLEKLASAQLPAIVLINDKGYHHFVVVKGMRDGRVLLGDPATGTRAISRKHFESIWVNQLLFVIHNRQDQARFNSQADWDAAPRIRLADGLRRDGLDIVTMPKLGATDF
jgi:predicted double-glycine peptidase